MVTVSRFGEFESAPARGPATAGDGSDCAARGSSEPGRLSAFRGDVFRSSTTGEIAGEGRQGGPAGPDPSAGTNSVRSKCPPGARQHGEPCAAAPAASSSARVTPLASRPAAAAPAAPSSARVTPVASRLAAAAPAVPNSAGLAPAASSSAGAASVPSSSAPGTPMVSSSARVAPVASARGTPVASSSARVSPLASRPAAAAPAAPNSAGVTSVASSSAASSPFASAPVASRSAPVPPALVLGSWLAVVPPVGFCGCCCSSFCAACSTGVWSGGFSAPSASSNACEAHIVSRGRVSRARPSRESVA